jgi:type II secretion system protein N
MAFTLTDRHKKILKWVGYPLFAIVTFVFALHYTFPYERVKERAIDALSDDYDVDIQSVEPGFFPGSVEFKGIMLMSRPEKDGEEVTRIFIDKVELDIGLFALIGGKTDIDIKAKIANGSVSGNIVVSKGSLTVDLTTKKLPLGQVPGLAGAIGLPMDGGLDADFELKLPKGRAGYEWKEADGRIKISCPSCTVGDGEAKISPKARSSKSRSAKRRAAFASGGVTVPRLDLGNLVAEIEINKGKGVIKQFNAQSGDGELYIDAELKLARKFKDSTMPGCMRFKVDDSMGNRGDDVSKNFANIQQVMGVPRDADGFSNVRIVGKMSALRWKPAKKCTVGGAAEPNRPTVTTTGSGGSKRPTLDKDALKKDDDDKKDDKKDDKGTKKDDKTDDVPTGAAGVKAGGPELGEAARAAGRKRGKDDVSPGPPKDDAASVDTARPSDEGDDDDDDDDEGDDDDDGGDEGGGVSGVDGDDADEGGEE